MASVDDIDSNTAFAKKNNAGFAILSDPKKSAAKAFGVMSALGFSKRWTYYIGETGEVLKIDTNVQPLTAGKDIEANLEVLGVAKNEKSKY